MKNEMIKQIIFWWMKGLDRYDIATRLKTTSEAVNAALVGYKLRFPNIVAKFQAWEALPGASVGIPQPTEFVAENDLSFSEQLAEAGVDGQRIAQCNKNYKSGI